MNEARNFVLSYMFRQKLVISFTFLIKIAALDIHHKEFISSNSFNKSIFRQFNYSDEFNVFNF